MKIIIPGCDDELIVVYSEWVESLLTVENLYETVSNTASKGYPYPSRIDMDGLKNEAVFSFVGKFFIVNFVSVSGFKFGFSRRVLSKPDGYSLGELQHMYYSAEYEVDYRILTEDEHSAEEKRLWNVCMSVLLSDGMSEENIVAALRSEGYDYFALVSNRPFYLRLPEIFKVDSSVGLATKFLVLTPYSQVGWAEPYIISKMEVKHEPMQVGTTVSSDGHVETFLYVR